MLLPIYGYYSYQTLKSGESQGDSELNALYLSKVAYKCTPRARSARKSLSGLRSAYAGLSGRERNYILT